MTYATGFHQAASIDAVRIAQATIHRDAQTQALATASVKRDLEKSRRIPEAERAAKQRDRFKRDPDREPEAGAPGGRTPGGPGSRLDFLA
ncbi:MAG: hypothetical protein IT200_14980 [Thermoleophilia bacterium]|nr:hypothetical protein [Thermoleophilia bacterium]